MSGGRFNYDKDAMSWKFQNAANVIHDIAENNHSKELSKFSGTLGYGFSDKTIKELLNGAKYMELAAIYEHRLDWLLSGDDSEETFHEQLQKDLERYKLEDVGG